MKEKMVKGNISITIDTSVYLSHFFKNEKHTATSSSFFEHVSNNSTIEIALPTISLLEIFAVLRRNVQDIELVEDIIYELEHDNSIVTIDINSEVISKSKYIIKGFSIKGMDSIYLAVAMLNNSILITWDKDQLKCNSKDVAVMTPKEFIKQFSKSN